MTRNIVVCILLYFITCGLYGIYWMYTLNEYARSVAPQEWQTSGLTVILLNIITCGIYGLYWNYKMGKAWPHPLYAIGAPLGMGFVALCLVFLAARWALRLFDAVRTRQLAQVAALVLAAIACLAEFFLRR